MCADHIKEDNVGMEKDEIRTAISHVKYEAEEEHERNIENMLQDYAWTNQKIPSFTNLFTNLHRIIYIWT